MSVPVCVSVREHLKYTSPDFSPNLVCMLFVAVAWSSSDGTVIRHVLPVLWMTSRLLPSCNVSWRQSQQQRRVRPNLSNRMHGFLDDGGRHDWRGRVLRMRVLRVRRAGERVCDASLPCKENCRQTTSRYVYGNSGRHVTVIVHPLTLGLFR